MVKRLPMAGGGFGTIHTGGNCCPTCAAADARWTPFFEAKNRGDVDEAKRIEDSLLVNDAKQRGVA